MSQLRIPAPSVTMILEIFPTLPDFPDVVTVPSYPTRALQNVDVKIRTYDSIFESSEVPKPESDIQRIQSGKHFSITYNIEIEDSMDLVEYWIRFHGKRKTDLLLIPE